MKKIETEVWQTKFDKDDRPFQVKRRKKVRSMSDPTEFSVNAFGVGWILDGAEAYKEGRTDNPHMKGSQVHTWWQLGFDVACQLY